MEQRLRLLGNIYVSIKHVKDLITQARCGEGSTEEILDALEAMLDLFESHTHTLKTKKTRTPYILRVNANPGLPYSVTTEHQTESPSDT